MANVDYIQVPRDRERQNRKTIVWLWYFPVVGAATLFGGIVAGCIAILVGVTVLGRPSIGAARQSGLAGEEALMRELIRLPDHYTVFNQVLVPNPRSRTGTTEIDFIVTGPGGVFILEAKNNKGSIVGGAEREATWLVLKVGRGVAPTGQLLPSGSPTVAGKPVHRSSSQGARCPGGNPPSHKSALGAAFPRAP